jgi:hypothetical protein
MLRYKVARGWVKFKKQVYREGQLLPLEFTERDKHRSVYSRRIEQVEISDEPAAEVKEEISDEPAAEVKEEISDEPAAEVKEEIPDEPAAEVKEEISDEPAAEVKEEIPDEPAAEVKEVENKTQVTENVTTPKTDVIPPSVINPPGAGQVVTKPVDSPKVTQVKSSVTSRIPFAKTTPAKNSK